MKCLKFLLLLFSLSVPAYAAGCSISFEEAPLPYLFLWYMIFAFVYALIFPVLFLLLWWFKYKFFYRFLVCSVFIEWVPLFIVVAALVVIRLIS